MAKKLKPGPIQQAWIKSLREHPKRQIGDMLGIKTKKGKYKACCLGEYLICAYNEIGLKPPFQDGQLIDPKTREFEREEDSLLYNSYHDLGFYSEEGCRKDSDSIVIHQRSYISLAEANDKGVSWIDIADYVEKNFDALFYKSI